MPTQAVRADRPVAPAFGATQVQGQPQQPAADRRPVAAPSSGDAVSLSQAASSSNAVSSGKAASSSDAVSSGKAVSSSDALTASYAATLAEQMASQDAAAEHNRDWYAAGMGPHDGHLIEQCERNDITPEDLRLRVDGRTMVSRLKNGESVSSVRLRIAEAIRGG